MCNCEVTDVNFYGNHFTMYMKYYTAHLKQTPRVSHVALVVKNTPVNAETQETRVRSLGREDILEKEMATHSSVHAWEIPRTEEPGGLRSTGSQSLGHDRSDLTHTQTHTMLYVNYSSTEQAEWGEEPTAQSKCEP